MGEKAVENRFSHLLNPIIPCVFPLRGLAANVGVRRVKIERKNAANDEKSPDFSNKNLCQAPMMTSNASVPTAVASWLRREGVHTF